MRFKESDSVYEDSSVTNSRSFFEAISKTVFQQAYSGTLSRRNLGRLKTTLGDFRRLKQNSLKHYGDFKRS